jgi:hypothetical protein
MYVVVCTSCVNCNSQAVAVFANKPTEKQVEEVKESAGGMFCIHSEIYDIPEGEIVNGSIRGD